VRHLFKYNAQRMGANAPQPEAGWVLPGKLNAIARPHSLQAEEVVGCIADQ
jgi:hypothetical protein